MSFFKKRERVVEAFLPFANLHFYFLYSLLDIIFNALTEAKMCLQVDVRFDWVLVWTYFRILMYISKRKRNEPRRGSETIFFFFTRATCEFRSTHSCNHFNEAQWGKVFETKPRDKAGQKKRINIQRWILSPYVLKFLHITGRIYSTCILVYRQAYIKWAKITKGYKEQHIQKLI